MNCLIAHKVFGQPSSVSPELCRLHKPGPIRQLLSPASSVPDRRGCHLRGKWLGHSPGMSVSCSTCATRCFQFASVKFCALYSSCSKREATLGSRQWNCHYGCSCLSYLSGKSLQCVLICSTASPALQIKARFCLELSGYLLGGFYCWSSALWFNS